MIFKLKIPSKTALENEVRIQLRRKSDKILAAYSNFMVLGLIENFGFKRGEVGMGAGSGIDFVTAIMKKYNELPQGPETDPTSLGRTKNEFVKLLLRQMSTFASDLRIKLVEDEQIGMGDEGFDSPEMVAWLAPYILGVVGEYAFIDNETYRSFRGSFRKPRLGRFGEGFLLSKEAFFAEGWNKVVDFESSRHPMSNFSPRDIFQEVINEMKNLRAFLQSMHDKAFRQLQSSLASGFIPEPGFKTKATRGAVSRIPRGKAGRGFFTPFVPGRAPKRRP